METYTRTGTGSVWVWSDLHIGHVKLAENWRGWAGGNVPDHNAMMKYLVNSRVRPEDELWIVGDACMGIVKDSLEFMKGFHGHKILIPGNHDRFHPAYGAKNAVKAEKLAKFRDMYAEVFTLMDPIVHDDQVIFCHFPWKGTDDHADRDIIEVYGPNRTDYPEGTVLIHGHTHSPERFGDMSVHVGVDAWTEGPLPMDTVMALAESLRQNGSSSSSS